MTREEAALELADTLCDEVEGGDWEVCPMCSADLPEHDADWGDGKGCPVLEYLARRRARAMTRRVFAPPRFTPADRLEALHGVAAAARVQLAAPDDDAWLIATDELAAAVARLDEIEAWFALAREPAA